MNALRHIRQYCLISISVFALFTAGTAMATSTLNADVGYIAMPHLPPGGNQVNPIRLAAIREAAMSLGAKGGLAWESKNINAALETESLFLDQTFDFTQMLLNHNVLPPVLVESNNSLNLANSDTLRIASTTYRIIQPARFVTAAPNWRNYLWLNFKKPLMPSRSLLPKTQAEAQVWNHYIRIGWANGVDQAESIFTNNLNRLKRDLLGMALYRQLLAKKMVSPPFVSKAQLGVTGDANQLRINDTVLRIVARSQLQPNPNKWRPILTK